ncbi:hypothetical protein Tco_0328072 [Tanacetum coccineum]
MEVLAALRNMIKFISWILAHKGPNGVWKEQPNDVKQEFLSHFQDRFAKPSERRANIDMRFPKTISEDQSQDLEREVSKQEIKMAVWGCGTDKSPGPDGCKWRNWIQSCLMMLIFLGGVDDDNGELIVESAQVIQAALAKFRMSRSQVSFLLSWD